MTDRKTVDIQLDYYGRSRKLTLRTQHVWAIVDAAREVIGYGAPEPEKLMALRKALSDLDAYDAQMRATAAGLIPRHS